MKRERGRTTTGKGGKAEEKNNRGEMERETGGKTMTEGRREERERRTLEVIARRDEERKERRGKR